MDCFKEKVNNPGEVAIKVSDRHFGVGSDGLILICPSDIADVRWICTMRTAAEGLCAETAQDVWQSMPMTTAM